MARVRQLPLLKTQEELTAFDEFCRKSSTKALRGLQ